MTKVLGFSPRISSLVHSLLHPRSRERCTQDNAVQNTVSLSGHHPRSDSSSPPVVCPSTSPILPQVYFPVSQQANSFLQPAAGLAECMLTPSFRPRVCTTSYNPPRVQQLHNSRLPLLLSLLVRATPQPSA